VPKYDIACVGAGMAGLAVAALLTKAGKTVCLIDPSDNAGGCVAAQEISGFRFTAGPTITYGFESGGILQKLCSDLGLSAGAASSFPGFQVVLPGHRITVFADPRETLEELVREFPDERHGLIRLYRDAHKLSERSSKSRLSSCFLRRRNTAAYLQSYHFGRSLTAYFDVQSRFFFGSSLQRMPLVYLVLMLTTVPHYLPGGFTRLADQLLSIVQQQSGSWFNREPFPELQFRANRITGIRTSRGNIEPRTVLLNVPGERYESVLFLGIRDEVIPVGMLPNLLCLADYERPDDLFTLSLSPGDDRMQAPVGMKSLIGIFSPETESEQLIDSLISRVTPVVPFLRNFQVISSMQDHKTRRLLLPPAVTVQSYEYRVGRPMLTPCNMKNLTIITDSVRFLLPAVFTAQTVVGKLA
jgi:hypothetical protein